MKVSGSDRFSVKSVAADEPNWRFYKIEERKQLGEQNWRKFGAASRTFRNNNTGGSTAGWQHRGVSRFRTPL